MAAGFLAGVLGIVLPSVAYMAASPLNFAVNKIVELLRYFQSLHGFVVSSKPTLPILFGWYGVLTLVGIVQYHKGLSSTETFKIPDQMLQ